MSATYALLFGGIFVCATAASLIQASRIDPMWLSALRVAIAALLLLPLFIRDWRHHRAASPSAWVQAAVAPGILLGLHFMSFLAGVRETTVANATLLVNLAPAIVPFFAWTFLDENITRGEVVGIGLGLAGVALLVGGDLRVGHGTLAGDVMCLGSMVLFAGYLVMGRWNRGAPSIWLFVVPLYAVAALVCLPAAAVRPLATVPIDGRREALLAFALGVGPTVLGHSALMFCLRRLRPHTVTLANLSQFIFAGVIAWFVSGELPPARFYPAAALLVSGAAIAIRATATDAAARPA